MTIKAIHVTAGRTFNHPFESYANFKFDLSFQAELAPGEDHLTSLAALQVQAETLADEHKEKILSDVQRRRQIERINDQLEDMRRNVRHLAAGEEQIAKLEAELTALTSQPLLLASKQVHPGHDEHPDTDEG